MKFLPVIAVIVLMVIVGVGAFYGGTIYQQRSRPSNGQRFQRDQLPGENSANGNRSIIGEIVSQDENSLTIKLNDGSSKIVILSDQTSINKTDTGSKDDLKTNSQVMVFGKDNTDGSVTAQNIQLNPQIRGQNPSNQPQ